jgi:hypothetical protein
MLINPNANKSKGLFGITEGNDKWNVYTEPKYQEVICIILRKNY